jgi:hypothetical protein
MPYQGIIIELYRQCAVAAGRDMRAEGNRRAYHDAYDRLYRALGDAHGYSRNHAGFYVDDRGALPGINDMYDTLNNDVPSIPLEG